MLVQIIRFTLLPSLTIAAPAVAKLRQHVSAAGATRQYLGYMTSTQHMSLPKKRHEICWIIPNEYAHGVWRQNFTVADKPALVGLDGITQGEPTTMLYDFDDTQLQELTRGIEAPICEMAFIRLSPDAPLSDPALRTSMHKTYTDCYKMQGFVGGQWIYSLNANHPNGVRLTEEKTLDAQDRRLALYFLGWESIELHQDASTTTIFAEEMDKLKPWFWAGSGAWYNIFQRYD